MALAEQSLPTDLADLLDIPKLQKLMEDFYAVAHIPMSILNLKGRVLVGVGWQQICTQFHRIHAETAKHCLESDIELSAGIPEGTYRLYKCKNNLWDIAMPIFVGGQKAGNIFSGQFFFEDETVDREFFRTQAWRYGFSEEEYLASLDHVPRLSRSTVEKGMSFFLTLADTLSQLGMSNLAQQRQLAEHERLASSLERAQEMAHLGSWELDLVTGTLSWSDEVYRIFGLQPQEFGATYEAFLSYVHPSDRAAVHRAYGGSLSENRDGYEIEHRVVRKSTGEVRWVHERCIHFRDSHGKIVRSLGMVHDLTERKAQEGTVESLARFPEENPYPVLRIGLDGKLLYANHAASDILLHFGSRIGGPAPGPFAEATQRVIKGKKDHKFDFTHGLAVYAFIAVAVPVQGYVNLYGRDVTEQRQAEAALRSLTEDLERRVQERTQQWEAANKELESFSYSVSHDLRAPLRRIEGFSALLEGSGQEHLTAKEREYFQHIRAETAHMDELIKALLEFSRLARQKPQVSQVETRPLVETLVSQQRALLGSEAGSRVQVEIGELPCVNADPVLIRQVFANLLSNAFKFTRPVEEPRITVTAEIEDGEVIFCVTDNGVGFDKAHAKKLFGVFQRLHAESEFEGTGIGLANVRRIVERHGGQVWADSEQGKGASFFFTLPHKEK